MLEKNQQNNYATSGFKQQNRGVKQPICMSLYNHHVGKP